MVKFNLEQISNAYFSENTNARKLRQNLEQYQYDENCESSYKLENKFFSNKNIYKLNKTVVNEVYKRTGNKIEIPLQNPQEIYIICKYIWHNNSRYLNYDIDKQLEELNHLVIEYIMPDLISTIKQKILYLKNLDVTKRKLIPRPNNSNRGNQILSSLSSVYHGNK